MSLFVLYWPVAYTLLLFLVRLFELSRKFEAVPGKVFAPGTFLQMVLTGSGSLILCVASYAYRGTPPPLPYISVAGATLALFTFYFRMECRKALAEMWSVHAEVRDNHRLVETGPYRRIRHPIYLGTLLEVVATAMILNTWIAGLVGLAATAVAIRRRIRAEESAMDAKLGDTWRRYAAARGGLFPKL